MLMRTSYAFPFRAPAQMQRMLWGPTANTSYRTHLLREIKGFDESFPFRLGGDDVDIGLRITQLGNVILGNPRAYVTHSPETWTPFAVVRRALRWGRMNYYLFLKHPAQRRFALPNTTSLGLILLCFMAANALTSRRPIFLLVPLLWWVIAAVIEAGLLASTGRKPYSILRDWCAAQFELLFEIGCMFESLRHIDFRLLYMAFSYLPTNCQDADDVVLVTERKLRRLWSNILSLIIVAGLLSFLVL
jgi:hypothetical protein